MTRMLLVLVSMTWMSSVFADPPSAMTAEETKALSQIVRQLIVKYLPDPAVTSKRHWGQQKEVIVRVDGERQGPFKWKFEPKKELRNDGHWTSLKLSASDPATKLGIELKDVATPEVGKTTFTAIITGPMNFGFDQQLWKSGIRLYSGETRGRCETTTALNCESTSKLDWMPGKLLPAQVLRVKITQADMSYEKIVVEHTAGLGGDAAKVVGDTVLKAVKLMKPNLEKELIEKANAAIVKAGDSKEIRLELDKLIAGKK